MRLDKYLADCGVGTRSEIKKLIKNGNVLVSGENKIKADMHIEPNSAEVWVFGAKLCYKKFIYLMLNKPQGYVSATWDKKLPTVLDLVPEEYLHYEPFPVGRLDIDTEGLCLLTNDGQLAHRILSPAKHIPKTYEAIIDKEVCDDDIREFTSGVILDDGYKTKPAVLEISPKDNKHIWVTITEGKFHQVKRMFEAVGKRVVYLKRVSMNKLCLDEKLEIGEIRELTEEEIMLLETRKKDEV